MEHLREILVPFIGVSDKLDWLNYNKDNKIFQVLFNGDPKNQLIILKTLLRNEYNVIEFSVPKAGLLENVFIELINSEASSFSTNTFSKNQTENEMIMER